MWIFLFADMDWIVAFYQSDYMDITGARVPIGVVYDVYQRLDILWTYVSFLSDSWQTLCVCLSYYCWSFNGSLTRKAKLRVVHAPGMLGTFPSPLRVIDPDMHHRTCVTHVPRCMPGSITSGFLWSRWRRKRSRYSKRMRNPQFCVSGKRPMGAYVTKFVNRFAKQSYCIRFHHRISEVFTSGDVLLHNIAISLSYKPFETCQILLWITQDNIRFLKWNFKCLHVTLGMVFSNRI